MAPYHYQVLIIKPVSLKPLRFHLLNLQERLPALRALHRYIAVFLRHLYVRIVNFVFKKLNNRNLKCIAYF